jgi:hypothetical protein
VDEPAAARMVAASSRRRSAAICMPCSPPECRTGLPARAARGFVRP